MTTSPNPATPPEALATVVFDAPTERKVKAILKRYPTRRAALLPLLWLCQDTFGWISAGVVQAVADRVGETPAFVEGVVSFYTMFRRRPPARFVLQACVTLSCEVCGGRELLAHLQERLGIGPGQVTADGVFGLEAVQCLGACGSAPVVQINDDYYESLTPGKLDTILDELRARKE